MLLFSIVAALFVIGYMSVIVGHCVFDELWYLAGIILMLPMVFIAIAAIVYFLGGAC